MKVKTVFNILSLPAVMCHELSHFIMIFLVGSKFSGITINITVDEKGVSYHCTVYNKANNKLKSLIISLAPSIFWVIGLIIFVATKQLIPFLFLWFFMFQLHSSKEDFENVMAILGYGHNRHTTSSDYLRSKIDAMRLLCNEESKTKNNENKD